MNDHFKKDGYPGGDEDLNFNDIFGFHPGIGKNIKDFLKMFSNPIFGTPEDLSRPENKPATDIEERMITLEAGAQLKGQVEINKYYLECIEGFITEEKNLHNQLDAATEKIDMLKGMLGSKDNEIRGLEYELDGFCIIRSNLESKISRLKDCLAAAENDLAIKTAPPRVIKEIEKLLVLGTTGLSPKELADKLTAIKQLIQSENAGKQPGKKKTATRRKKPAGKKIATAKTPADAPADAPTTEEKTEGAGK